jgi:anti-sigma B factor antagonist
MSRFSAFQQSGVTVLRVSGANFDTGVTGAFLKAVNVAENDFAPVVVDLSAVEFIDSSGLGALYAFANLSKSHTVRLAGGSARLMARLARVLGTRLPQYHETLVDAIVACRPAEVIERESRPRPSRCVERSRLA